MARPSVTRLLARLLWPLPVVGALACVPEADRVVAIALPVDVTAEEESGEDGVYMTLIRRWEEANPGWEVDVHWLSAEADHQRSQMVVGLQSDGLVYDVLRIDNQSVAEFAEQDWLVPVDTEDAALSWGGFLDRAQDAVCYGDRTWAVPLHMDVGLLYYRADLVGPEEVTDRIDAEGWRGLLELAEEERDEHGLEHGYTGQFGNYEGLTVNALEFLLGGHPDRADSDQELFEDAEGEACPAAVGVGGDFLGLRVLARGLQPDPEGEVASVIPQAAMNETEAEGLNRFRGGDVVFLRHWPHLVPRLQADAANAETVQEGLRWVGWGGESDGAVPAFGVLRLPTAVLGGQSLVVTSEARHPDQAWSLVRYMTGEDAQGLFHGSGLLPARVHGYRLEASEQRETVYWTELREAIDEGRLRPRTPYYPYVSEVLRDQVHTQLNRYTPEPHPDDMVCELTSALAGKVSSCG